MFSSILSTMIAAIQSGLNSINKQITDYTSSSIIGVILAAIASVISELSTDITTAQQQAYLSTATGTDLDNKANDYGIVRKQATFAQWTFVATKQIPSTQNITIPQNSIVTTQPTPTIPAITFSTTSDVILGSGSTSVNIPVVCQQAGTIGNIAPNTYLLWGSAVPGIDGVEFVSTANGVPAIDTETDSALRARALASFAGLSISTSAWYKNTADSVTGISSASVVPQGRGPGTVDIYVVGEGNTIPSSTLISTVQSTIDAGRIITDNAKVWAPAAVVVNVTMSIVASSGYDPVATAASVQTAITNYINNMGIGGGTNGTLYLSQLQSIAFGVTGVANAPPPTLPSSDIVFSFAQLPQAGIINITGSNVL